jgi:Eukaryotic aspartyl protease
MVESSSKLLEVLASRGSTSVLYHACDKKGESSFFSLDTILTMTMTTPTASKSHSSSSSSSTTTTPKQNKKNMQSITIHASTERRHKALLGQLEHHSNRRRILVEEEQQRRRNLQQQQQQQDEASSYHPATWRRSLQSNDDNDNNNKNIDPWITSVELSNCHLVLYSGDIALGSNQQRFRVDFDTASSDLWVAGTDCTKCPNQHPTWRLFTATASTTYQTATDSNNNAERSNDFNVQYDDGEMVRVVLTDYYDYDYYCYCGL